ncbi:MAG: hypothetical protein WCS88_01900 [Patescibacteria group bacterium]|jgi:MoaA/NifB/PqqE/SkfB family radical SAM enzyme
MCTQIANLDWFITRKCGQRKYCKFCFAPWNVFPPDTTLSGAMDICERIGELKIPIVTLCGGEPSEHLYIAEVVQKLYKLGIQITLYSNIACQENMEIIKCLLPNIQILSLPIDAVSLDVLPKMRGVHQFETMSSMLKYLVCILHRPKIKVGTVVTKQNVSDLDNILEFLLKAEIIDVWRIYQYSPYGKQANIIDNFLLEDEIFEREMIRIKNQTRNCGLDISFRNRRDNIGYCHIMDSQGNFYYYKEEYINLGVTIYDTPSQILKHYDENRNYHQKGWQQ